MLDRSSPIRLVSALALVCLLVIPAGLESQCATNAMAPFTFLGDTFVTKTIVPNASCMTVAMNAMTCFPGAVSMNGMSLFAVRAPATTNAYCNWVCNCPGSPAQAITISAAADGLPVELMDFGIEADETSGSAEESHDDAEDEAVR